jgi:hypothetical protein
MITKAEPLTARLPAQRKTFSAKVRTAVGASAFRFFSGAASVGALSACTPPTYNFSVSDNEGQKKFEAAFPVIADRVLTNAWVKDKGLSYESLALPGRGWALVSQAEYGVENYGDFLRSLNGGAPSPMDLRNTTQRVAGSIFEPWNVAVVKIRVPKLIAPTAEAPKVAVPVITPKTSPATSGKSRPVATNVVKVGVVAKPAGEELPIENPVENPVELEAVPEPVPAEPKATAAPSDTGVNLPPAE